MDINYLNEKYYNYYDDFILYDFTIKDYCNYCDYKIKNCKCKNKSKKQKCFKGINFEKHKKYNKEPNIDIYISNYARIKALKIAVGDIKTRFGKDIFQIIYKYLK